MKAGRGILSIAADRMRSQRLDIRTQALYLGYIEAFLRFHNRPQHADRLAASSGEDALAAFLQSLRAESGLDARGLVVARRAIRLLYAEVFLAPLKRSVRPGNRDPAAQSFRCSAPPAADSCR